METDLNPSDSVKKARIAFLKIDHTSRGRGTTHKNRKLFAACLAIVVLIGSVTLALKSRTTVVLVTSARPVAGLSAQALLNASGYVTPRRRATVAAKVTGRVEKVFAEEGLQVNAGQVLATLDCSQPLAALSSARADRDAAAAAIADLEVQLSYADRELERAEGLRAASIYSQEALDNARTARNSVASKISLNKEQTRAMDAKIGVAQQDVINCTVRSPYTGIVVSKDAQVGEIVSPISAGGGFIRTGIATVVDMQSIEIEVDVNESYIARVRPGQKVIAVLDAYPDWQVPSKVRTVIPTADRQKATVKVRIAFDRLDPRILPDMGVKVAFLNDQSPALQPETEAHALIPKSSVHTQDGKQVVFLVRDGRLERRVVKLGAVRGDDVEVMAGLSPSDVIVIGGVETLRDGELVETKQK